MSSNSSSNSSLLSGSDDCLYLETSSILASLSVVYILLMPLFVFVLFVGYQRWREQRLNSQLTSSSHIDIFTYNMAVMDLLGVLGTFLIFFGIRTDEFALISAGCGLLSIVSTGEMLFHLLTCMERYLAVVHPVIYLQLRGSAGVRMRNVTIGCVWLISLLVFCIALWLQVPFESTYLVFLSFTSVAFCFSSISVLCALFRPGPGEGGRKGVHADQSKQKALQTMLIITASLSVRFISSLITPIVKYLSVPNSSVSCLIGWASVWFLLPSDLVLPLLFLQRVGKLKFCGHKSVKQHECH